MVVVFAKPNRQALDSQTAADMRKTSDCALGERCCLMYTSILVNLVKVMIFAFIIKKTSNWIRFNF